MSHMGKSRALRIAYLGGGSKNWARLLMSDLALQEELSGTVALYDIDRRAAEMNCRIGNSLAGRADVRSTWRYEVAETLREALTGADFVVISILPGTFEEMRSDVHAPEKFGIWQSVGDTVGPAGLMRALRVIPMYREFAEQIKAHAPGAWVINYTNPMTLCVRTLYEVFPGVKAFGCCHNVFEAQHTLARALADVTGAVEPPRHEIRVNVLGVNHFTWIDRASWQDVELMDVFRRFTDKHAEAGFLTAPVDVPEATPFSSVNLVGMDLYRRCGVIPASSDRHIAEFFPPWYLKDPETVRRWRFHLTTVQQRIQWDKEMDVRRNRILSGEESFALEHSGEEGILQMKAVLGLGDFVTNVNIPNAGQMPGLPAGCVVETNALLSRDSVVPLHAGRLPDDLHSLLVRHVCNQEMILRAGLDCDRELAFRAFINDPLVTTGLEDSRTLFGEMLRNTAKYLPGWRI